MEKDGKMKLNGHRNINFTQRMSVVYQPGTKYLGYTIRENWPHESKKLNVNYINSYTIPNLNVGTLNKRQTG